MPGWSIRPLRERAFQMAARRSEEEQTDAVKEDEDKDEADAAVVMKYEPLISRGQKVMVQSAHTLSSLPIQNAKCLNMPSLQ